LFLIYYQQTFIWVLRATPYVLFYLSRFNSKIN
jgi:hypothetical protein